MRPRAVIIGAPGSGKSTVGRLLADELGVDFADSDTLVEQRAGKPIAEMFTEDGEQAFRALEERVVADTLTGYAGVLALGGGAVLAESTRERLHGHTVVLLGVGLSEGFRRSGMSTARPLLGGVNPRATYRMLLEARLPIYRASSTVEIDTDELDPQQVADEVATRLARHHTDTEVAPTGNGGSDG